MKARQVVVAAVAAMTLAPAAMAQTVVVESSSLKIGYQKVAGNVSFADLNLKKPEGVEALRARVRDEAKKMCSSSTDAAEMKGCVDHIVDRSAPKIDKVVKAARGG